MNEEREKRANRVAELLVELSCVPRTDKERVALLGLSARALQSSELGGVPKGRAFDISGWHVQIVNALGTAFRPSDAPESPTAPPEPVEARSGDEVVCGRWYSSCFRPSDAPAGTDTPPEPVEASSDAESGPELPCDTCLHWKPDEAKGHRLPSCPIPLGASCFSCRACRSCTGYEPKPAPESEPERTCGECERCGHCTWTDGMFCDAWGEDFDAVAAGVKQNCPLFTPLGCEPKPAPDCDTCTGPSVVFDAAVVVDEPKPESKTDWSRRKRPTCLIDWHDGDPPEPMGEMIAKDFLEYWNCPGAYLHIVVIPDVQ